jgi:hypothetical protein
MKISSLFFLCSPSRPCASLFWLLLIFSVLISLKSLNFLNFLIFFLLSCPIKAWSLLFLKIFMSSCSIRGLGC